VKALFVILSIFIPITQISATTETDYNVHIMQKGDTLWHLSISSYGYPGLTNLLIDYNNITDVKRIPIGREIKIPKVIFYKVKVGDTLSEISQKLLRSSKKYSAIAEYNDIQNADLILKGAVIKIPLIPNIDVALAEKRAKLQVTPITEQKPIPEQKETPSVEKPVVPEEKKPEEVAITPKQEQPPIEKEEKPVSEEIVTPKVEEKATQLPIEEVKPSTKEKPEEVVTPTVEEKAPQPTVEETQPPVTEKPEEIITPKVEEKVPQSTVEEAKPSVTEEPKETVPETKEETKPVPVVAPTEKQPIATKKPITEVLRKPDLKEPVPSSQESWLPISPWIIPKSAPEEKTTEPEKYTSLKEAIAAMDHKYIVSSKPEPGVEERGVKLPMQSLLQIEGYKSVMIEYNKTHYFGKSDINRYGGYYSSGGLDSGYGGYDYGGYGSYGSGYDPYSSSSSYYGGSSSYYGNYGSSYGSSYGSQYGGYGNQLSSGINIEQELDIHIHGRIGPKTHVDVDYNDAGKSQFGGMGQKEQKISVWYQGSMNEIIQKAAFGDITLDLPNTKFLNINRNLFGAEVTTKIGDLIVTAFGSRTKGIKETWTSRGQSREAGGGIGSRILDLNYIKERYYAINVGTDGMIHNSYLPIEPNSEVIYIDDGIGTNNDSGISTAQGYFDFLYPGADYNIDYTTGQIEFLKNISSEYRIVVTYKYRGDGGGIIGRPDAMFVDDDKNGVIDDKDNPQDPLGYVVIKETGQHGSELKNVYSLGNKNINRRNFSLSIWREGGTDSFQADTGKVLYNRIFGLDSDGDGLVDPELIDFDKGTLMFRSPRPFMIDDPNSPYYKYKDVLNNEAIYSENPKYTDEKYVIQADYTYQTPSFYIGRLNILPDSEEVKVNGRKLKRNVDYLMIYEVGSVEIFRQLDEYDEITVDYEYMPFGGQFQQTIAGIWAQYSPMPKKKETPGGNTPNQYNQTPGNSSGYQDNSGSPLLRNVNPSGSSYDNYSNYSGNSSYSDYSNSNQSSYGGGYDYSSSYGGGYSNYGGSSFGGSSYGGYSDYGSSYGGGYSSYDSYSYGGRRGSYSSFSSSRSRGSSMPGRSQRLNLAMGYIYNAGQRSTDIPDVNSAPGRLQAFVFNGSWGHEFNVAKVIGLVPFVSVKGRVPWSIYLNGESAYSRNNPNSAGFAIIDSMEGAKESSRMPTYKYSWQLGSVPVFSTVDATIDNRAMFQIVNKDKEASYGNYMKNKEVSAVEINSLSSSIQQYQTMEIGYELNDSIPWGSLSHSISPTGSDFSTYQFMEIWLKVEGDKNVNLNIDFGTVSEDTDDDFRLDSEDLPENLEDDNGDHKIDILDLNKKNLSAKDKYKGNGSLDIGEDTGWVYNGGSGAEFARVGKENSILDTEDLDGDVVLDTTDSYFEFTVPLNAIPSDWIRRENHDSGWIFLSIPIESAVPQGRAPTWGAVKHARIWLEKNEPGTAVGKLQWYSISVSGNSWDKGLIVDNSGKLTENKGEKALVGTKNNFEYDDYLKEYKTIENNKDFSDLHPYVENAFSTGNDTLEQSLAITYNLQPNSTAYTMRELTGLRRGDGQDFSKHNNVRLWVHGDGSKSTLILRMGSGVDDFGAGSPIRATTTDTSDQSVYSYYPTYSSLGGLGYYEYTKVIDFTGWKLITISLEDKDGDGQPDSMKPVNKPTLTNIGQILLGIKNNSQFPIDGEIWLNEIHLNEPDVTSGWANRFDLATNLSNIFSLRAGYAKQGKDFENSAGQSGRINQMSMGYRMSNYDYNVSTELSILPWLPINYDLSHQESESISSYGIISSYDSGKTITDNRTLSTSLDFSRIPKLSFSYDNQKTWNESRGNETSNLYSSDLRYALGSKLNLSLGVDHEVLNVDSSKASSNTSTSSYYYYGSYNDSKVDSGSISLQISPFSSFSINPSYDVRRELEKQSIKQGTNTIEKYALSSRDQRFSLRPTLRQFWGIRPSLSGRYDFREDWVSGEKDATMTTNFTVGLNFSLRSLFEPKVKKDQKDKKVSKSETKDVKTTSKDSPTEAQKTADKPKEEGTSVKDNSVKDESANTEVTDQNEYNQDYNRTLSPEEQRNRVDEMMQQDRGNWIEKDANELKKTMSKKQGQNGGDNKGVLRRSFESFTFNTDFGYDINDYLRQLKPDMGFFDIIKLDKESEYRNRSTSGSRFSVRSNVEPFTWSSLGFTMSFTNRFTKAMGTASNYDTSTIGGDMKFTKKNTSLMLRYDMTNNSSDNRSGPISSGTSQSPSVTFRSNWKSGVGTAFGLRTTIGNQERGDVKTSSLILAPNFNIDYTLHVEGKKLGIPFIGKSISMNQNLDVNNTISSMIRREKLGVNRDEKSEQYGTSLDMSYNLRETIRATMRLSVDYNHDRVQKDADYVSVTGSLMVRGEIR